jgi:hypothetical protein
VHAQGDTLGDTLFVSTAAAYDALPAARQQRHVGELLCPAPRHQRRRAPATPPAVSGDGPSIDTLLTPRACDASMRQVHPGQRWRVPAHQGAEERADPGQAASRTTEQSRGGGTGILPRHPAQIQGRRRGECHQRAMCSNFFRESLVRRMTRRHTHGGPGAARAGRHAPRSR